MQVHAEEAELRQLGVDLAREDALLEPLADLREHTFADELPHGVADRALLVRQQRVDREEVARVQRLWRRGLRGHEMRLVEQRGQRRVHVVLGVVDVERRAQGSAAHGGEDAGALEPLFCARQVRGHDRGVALG